MFTHGILKYPSLDLAKKPVSWTGTLSFFESSMAFSLTNSSVSYGSTFITRFYLDVRVSCYLRFSLNNCKWPSREKYLSESLCTLTKSAFIFKVWPVFWSNNVSKALLTGFYPIKSFSKLKIVLGWIGQGVLNNSFSFSSEPSFVTMVIFWTIIVFWSTLI